MTTNGSTSWYGFAEQILKYATKQHYNIKLTPVTTKQYPQVVPRPKNSKLDTTKLQQVLNFTLPTWQQELKRTMLLIEN